MSTSLLVPIPRDTLSAAALGAGLPVPRRHHPAVEAAVVNAVRLLQFRSDLIATGAFTVADLARGRASSEGAIYQWLRRASAAHRLFTVDNQHETLVPALLLDEVLDPRPAWQPVIKALLASGETGWGAWAWIATPTTWLDGAIPAEVLQDDPDAVVVAAQAKLAASEP